LAWVSHASTYQVSLVRLARSGRREILRQRHQPLPFPSPSPIAQDRRQLGC
jgi:hypothetical protein